VLIKTSELTNQALDWTVALCEGIDDTEKANYRHYAQEEYSPSTNWSQGGPIIEREGIELLCNLTATEAARFSCGANADWQAFHKSDRRTEARQFAATPLIAAMRCYVARKLGDEVEIPDKLERCS
jgi:hypothetical protein